MPEVPLYDRGGLSAGTAEVDETPTATTLIEVCGILYMWDQWVGGYREMGPLLVGTVIAPTKES